MPARPDRESLPYRDCVGIAVFNGRGEVFIGRRTPEGAPEKNAEYGAPWQMPQGGIDKGEDPLKAALRELYEETSINAVSLLAEAPEWIYYDLPDEELGTALRGKYRGQRQRWFAFRFLGDSGEIRVNPPPGGHEAEFDRWDWRRMDDLSGLVVPFKRKVYDEVVAKFRHLAG